MKIWCDSSTREACFVPEGCDPIVVPYDKPVTNNAGEYKAIILALEWAEDLFGEVEILTDSLLVTNQVLGIWGCKKKHLLPYLDKVKSFLYFNDIVRWIPREENLAGKVLQP